MADVHCPSSVRPSPRAPSRSGSSRSATTVAADEPLFEVSTDKVDTEVPSPVAGTLIEIRVHEGDTVAGRRRDRRGRRRCRWPGRRRRRRRRRWPPSVRGAAGAAIAEAEARVTVRPRPLRRPSRRRPRLRTGAGPAPAAEAPPPPPPPEPAAAQAPPAPPAAAPAAPAADEAATGGDNRLLSPVVRRLVNEHGLDPAAIEGTGPGGRITREDVARPHRQDGVPGRAGRRGGACSGRAGCSSRGARAGVSARSGRCSDVSARGRSRACRGEAGRRGERAAARAGERDESVRLSKIRQLTGDHMIMSKAVTPHAFSVVEVDYANVDRTRSRDQAASGRPARASASRTSRSSAGRSSTRWRSSRT